MGHVQNKYDLNEIDKKIGAWAFVKLPIDRFSHTKRKEKDVVRFTKKAISTGNMTLINEILPVRLVG